MVIGSQGQSTYIISDSSMEANVRIIEGTNKENARFIKVKGQNDKIIKYTPQDLQGYKLRNGKVYISEEVILRNTLQRVFLERLVTGQTKLYYIKDSNRKYFYIQKDSSSLIPINKKDSLSNKKVFRQDLGDLFEDCNIVKAPIEQSSYNKKSLAILTKSYNACKLKPMPQIKFGLLLGINISNLFLSTNDHYLKDASFNIDKGLSAGAYCDVPLYIGNLYIHPEIYYLEHAFLYNTNTENGESDIVINYKAFSLPILLRYTFPRNKFQPFANIGAIYSMAIKNENAIYNSHISNSVVQIDKINSSDIISGNQFGFSTGIGTHIDINNFLSFSFELRYNKLYSFGSNLLNKDIFNVIIGYNF